MKIDLESMPTFFAECGDRANDANADLRATVRMLAGRCALFSGVVSKMAKHIAELEKQISTTKTSEAEKPTNGKAGSAEGEPNEPPEIDETGADLDEQIRRQHPGIQFVEPAVQKGTLTDDSSH